MSTCIYVRLRVHLALQLGQEKILIFYNINYQSFHNWYYIFMMQGKCLFQDISSSVRGINNLFFQVISTPWICMKTSGASESYTFIVKQVKSSNSMSHQGHQITLVFCIEYGQNRNHFSFARFWVIFSFLYSHFMITDPTEHWQFYRPNKPKTMNILYPIQSNNSIIKVHSWQKRVFTIFIENKGSDQTALSAVWSEPLLSINN